jgi:hypothetical protein
MMAIRLVIALARSCENLLIGLAQHLPLHSHLHLDLVALNLFQLVTANLLFRPSIVLDL